MTASTPTLRFMPREAWASHPRYPAQALLLESHRSFLEISKVLIDAARRKDSLSGIESLFRRWIFAMRGHEAYEETKLYPYLERRWGLSFEEAKAGHEELHAAYDRVIAAFAAREGMRSEAICEALEAHDDILRRHLDHEEELVIPALLELTPEAFARYYDGDIESLLRELEVSEGRAG